jgi:phosphate acyltransferase
MKIGFDIMGGDYAPAEAIKGAQQFLEQVPDPSVHLLLIGSAELAAPYMSMLDAYQGRYTLVDAPQVIGMNEHPTKALKEKPQSSIAIGFGMMQMGKADAFISAGNTGAMMVGAMYSVKTIEGILRPTIASPVPRLDGNGFNLLLDVGINADCKPENLVQFAQLGALFVQKVYGVENPRAGLMNIGEEEGKGNLLAQATYPLLKEHPQIDFYGNLEGRDIFSDKANVIVCEGFVGNVILKLAESIHSIFTSRGISDPFLDNFNYEIYGGTPILGINSPVIIGHGISHALAFKNMIDVARRIIDADLMNAFKKHFAQAVVE